MRKQFYTSVLLVTLILCVGCVSVVSIWFAIRTPDLLTIVFPPTSTPSPEEQELVETIATRLGVAPNWSDIDDYVSYTYVSLGLSRDEVHWRLQQLGTFQIEDVRNYVDGEGRAVLYEQITFDNPHLLRALGYRVYVYDRNAFLIESHVHFSLPSRDSSRLLPPPPTSSP